MSVSRPLFELERLGWKAFQDLCLTVVREVLGQDVSTFLASKDGGRDGAFYGRWAPRNGDDTLDGAFVVQCKHTAKPATTLVPSDMDEDIAKTRRLAERDLADVYILLTNAGVSGGTEATLLSKYRDAGVKHFRLFGADWLSAQIYESPRLRALVPRLYGLGDLSEILDEREYAQAQAVLESAKESLSKFVVTQAYNDSIRALDDHQFVLLLGEPAAGKTMIATALAVAALDSWVVRVIKADYPEAVRDHWNPNDRNQLFWIDDAFGANQYQADRVDAWNRLLPQLQAAANRGTRFIMTSRDYVYTAARQDLREDVFPRLREGQVVVNVHDLSLPDKQQILYNHLKLGRQPRAFLTQVKPYLDTVAESDHFLPEVARRLADPVFTRDLELSRRGLVEFVDHPVAFLNEVIARLSRAHRAALALVFNSGGALPSPVGLTSEDAEALRLFGVAEAEALEALNELNGSLVALMEHGDDRWWVPRHPTILDALSRFVAADPELMDIYLASVPLEKLMREVTCGDIGLEGATVVVPRRRFSLIIKRLREKGDWFDDWADRWTLCSFLERRCSDAFLRELVAAAPEVLDRLAHPGAYLSAYAHQLALTKYLHDRGLFPERHRRRFVQRVASLAVDVPDAGYIMNPAVRSFLTPDELSSIDARVRSKLLAGNLELLADLRFNYDVADDPADYLSPQYDALMAYSGAFADDPDAMSRIQTLRDELDELRSELDEDYDPPPDADAMEWADRLGADLSTAAGDRSVFDDIDL